MVKQKRSPGRPRKVVVEPTKEELLAKIREIEENERRQAELEEANRLKALEAAKPRTVLRKKGKREGYDKADAIQDFQQNYLGPVSAKFGNNSLVIGEAWVTFKELLMHDGIITEDQSEEWSNPFAA